MTDHLPVSDDLAAPATPAASATPAGSAAPVLPVPPHEPPYYAVVFTSLRSEDATGYAESASRMEELVQGVPGFLGMDYARTPGGLSITVGYFRDKEAIAVWRRDLEHRAAQKRGREQWYERYSVHVCAVERSYAFARDETPSREDLR
jgi:heme-degrading monooxygenase HmoA